MTNTINFKIDWLVLFIVLLPTFYIAGMDVRLSQMNFFQLSIFLLVALFHVTRYIGLFLGWAVFQFLFFKNSPWKSYLLPNIFFAALLYHFRVKYADLTKRKRYRWTCYGVGI